MDNGMGIPEGTPSNDTLDSLGEVQDGQTKHISFPLNDAGERVIHIDHYDSAGEQVDSDSQVQQAQQQGTDPVGKTKQLVDTGQPVVDTYEKRYKDIQEYGTKVAQQNSTLREQLAVARRDIEHLLSIVSPANTQGKQNPEDWNDTVSSPEKFEGYLNKRDANSWGAIPRVIQEYLWNDPVYRESAFRMSLDRAVAVADKEGVDFKALLPEIEAVMSVNPTLNFEQALSVAKNIASRNGKVFTRPASGGAAQTGTSKDSIKARAERLKLEKNQASGSVKKPAKPIKPGSVREMLEQAFDDTLSEYGLE